MSKLVIVESPAKAKTIKKYLGGDYEVIASMGHVRDLPKARLCVDVKNDFKPKYAIIKGKEKLVSELKEAAEEADTVYLATDPDREGEAISWHLAYILGLDEDYHNRVTFNEITKTGITEGMAHPRSIDQNLVNARRAAFSTALWVIRSARSSQKRFAAVFPQAVCSLLHCASSWTARKRSASLSPKNTGLSTHA